MFAWFLMMSRAVVMVSGRKLLQHIVKARALTVDVAGAENRLRLKNHSTVRMGQKGGF